MSDPWLRTFELPKKTRRHIENYIHTEKYMDLVNRVAPVKVKDRFRPVPIMPMPATPTEFYAKITQI